MSTNKSSQPATVSGANRCPVCGHATYSAGGIHPQCALKRADIAIKKALAATEMPLAEKSKINSWSKRLPK